MQNRHDLIDGDLCGNSRDQCRNHEQIANQVIAAELESVQHIRQHGGNHGTAHQHTNQNQKAVEKRFSHVCLFPCHLEILKVQPAFRQCHNTGRAVFFIVFKCRCHTADDRHQCTECTQQQNRIL